MLKSATFRYIILFTIIIVVSAGIVFVVQKNEPNVDLGVRDTSSKAFSHPLPGLTQDQSRSFLIGRTIFHGISNDSRSLESRGIGPTYNAMTCSDCHAGDGTANPKTSPALLVKLYNPETKDHSDPHYGFQIHDTAVPPAVADAKITRSNDDVTLSNFSRGEPADSTFLYQRIAPRIIGAGLIEAIPNSFFTQHADPKDSNHDGISGRINWVKDTNGKKAIGRFGWKSTMATVHDQTLLAAFQDIGLTNSAFAGSDPAKKEMTKEQEDNLVFYARSIAPTKARTHSTTEKNGRAKFTSLGCASCHTQNITLDLTDIVTKKNSVIHPFSDFLLHDMGKKLADPIAIDNASASEFRTAPLWGLGLIETVNGSVHLLHDGRATSIDQAIRLHDGEARTSAKKYKELTAHDRRDVLAYLNSL